MLTICLLVFSASVALYRQEKKLQVHAGNRRIQMISQSCLLVASVALKTALQDAFLAPEHLGGDTGFELGGQVSSFSFIGLILEVIYPSQTS
jgi:hypothetical protein